MKRRGFLSLAPAAAFLPASAVALGVSDRGQLIQLHGNAIAVLARELFPEADQLGARISCHLLGNAQIEVSALNRHWVEDCQLTGRGRWIEKRGGCWSSEIGYC